MRQNCIFDPGIESHDGRLSSNLGDLIIQCAVERELKLIFPQHQFVRISTQERLGAPQRNMALKCEYIFVGGTNLLSSNMRRYRQWQVFLYDAMKLRKRVILFGVGWWQYQGNVDLYTRSLLKLILADDRFVHSVRDTYSLEKLKSAGVTNTLNTSCPTLWPVLNLSTDSFPTSQARTVLTTLTDYNQAPAADRALLRLLAEKYENVFLWPQGRDDLAYARSLDVPVHYLEHSIEALENFLQSTVASDYVGTRLHCGIRCLNGRRRSLILSIDNRAAGIAKDTGLPIEQRENIGQISRWISGSDSPKIVFDKRAIESWKAQFVPSKAQIKD